MKKAKRTISILLIAIMLMSSMVTYADTTIGEKAIDMLKSQLEVMRLQAQNVQSFVTIMKDLIPLMLQKFKDVKESDWYRDNLALLFGMNIIEGDGKGNFLPNKEVSASEFLKMVIVAVDNKTYAAAPNESWDKPYIRRAKELGLVMQGDIGLYTSPLNRYQMARIIVRACNEEFDDISQYRSSLKDYERMPAEYEDYVLKAYSKGIINGLPDGTFGGDNTMKRAEATAVIARLIDPSQRKTPQKPADNELTNDLVNVPVHSEAKIEIEGPKGKDNPHNVDFSVLFLLFKPIEPQYKDAQNLLETRFGKDNSSVKEIMAYIKSKDIRKKELKLKEWTINNQLIMVSSNPNSMTIDLTVWRTK